VLPLAELVPGAEEPARSGTSIITDNLAPIGSFVLSFVVIARFWAAHHRVFDDAPRVGPTVVWVNTVWLFTIVVLPFPTEMIGSFPDDSFTQRFYVATLFVSSTLLTVIDVLVERSRPPGTARRTPSGASGVILLLILVATFVAPQLGYWTLLALFASSPVERLLAPVTARWVGRREG
jgi:uncharacterized membrane protein